MVQDIASNRDRAEKPLPLPPYKLIPSRLEKALPTSEDAGSSSGGDMATFLRTFAFPRCLILFVPCLCLILGAVFYESTLDVFRLLFLDGDWSFPEAAGS